MHTVWPRVAEVEQSLIDMGYRIVSIDDDGVETSICSLGSGIVGDGLILAAVQILENEIGDSPLLAESTARAIAHDPPGQRQQVNARSGGSRLLRLVRPAVEITSITVNGAAQTASVDYFPLWVDGDGVRMVEFSRPIFGPARSVVVTAKWGRWETLPDAVWEASSVASCGLAIQRFREGAKALPVRWAEGDVSEAYGEEMLRTAGDGLIEQAKQLVRPFMNMGVWF